MDHSGALAWSGSMETMVRRVRWVGLCVALVPLVLVGSRASAAAPPARASAAAPPARASASARPAEHTAPESSAEKLSFLRERQRSRWDYVTVGGGGAYVMNLILHLLTYHFRHVRLTALELMCTFNMLETASWDWHVGPTVGFGGYHGPRDSLSHWFVTGVWYGQMHPISLADVPTTYRGLFLMAGYEFRLHFGRHLDWLFGLRAFGAYSPLGANQTGSCRCTEGDWFCDCEPDPVDRIRYPLVFGVVAFFGY